MSEHDETDAQALQDLPTDPAPRKRPKKTPRTLIVTEDPKARRAIIALAHLIRAQLGTMPTVERESAEYFLRVVAEDFGWR